MAGQLKVTQVKSAIGRKRNQRETLRSLGLKRIHDSVVQEDRPEIRGTRKKCFLASSTPLAMAAGTSLALP